MGDDDSSWEELEEVVEPSVGTGGSTYTGGSITEKIMSLLKGLFWVSSSKFWWALALMQHRPNDWRLIRTCKTSRQKFHHHVAKGWWIVREIRKCHKILSIHGNLGWWIIIYIYILYRYRLYTYIQKSVSTPSNKISKEFRSKFFGRSWVSLSRPGLSRSLHKKNCVTCNGTAFEDTRASSLSDRWGVFGAEVREVRKKLPNLKEYVKSMKIYLAMAYS